MSATHDHPAPSVQACRDEIAAQIQAYRDLVGAASKASGMSLTRIDAALAAFEPAFFNNLLIALDARFAGRPNDPGPSAETRALAASLLHDGGVLAAHPQIAYDADQSVLRLEAGERIWLNADDFEALCSAFLAAMQDAASRA
ncbi:MAG: hypothetical protein ACJ8GJ_15060 [Vitreoscilla sp.]